MKLSRASGVAMAAAHALISQADAYPHLHQRGAYTEAAQIIIELFAKLFNEAFFTTSDAWDYGANPQMCSVKMETIDGGACKASVTCADGVTNEFADWNVCYVGGRQYLNDPRIGDFSITFTQKDGTEGQGLTNPVLQLAYVDNWREIPVTDLTEPAERAASCDRANGANCELGPFVCHWGDLGGDSIEVSRPKRWECGMPMVGKGGPEGTGLDSNGPVNELGYASGWCVAHVTQYQKPDPAVDSYGLEATIYDPNENDIGNSDGKQGPTISLTSLLPWTPEITTGGVDDDPVTFAYADQSWDSNDASRCSVGSYDSGSREMDCGFTC